MREDHSHSLSDLANERDFTQRPYPAAATPRTHAQQAVSRKFLRAVRHPWGLRPPTLNTWQRGTLSAGWLLCDKSPLCPGRGKARQPPITADEKCWFKHPVPWGGAGAATISAAFPLII